MWGKAYPGCAPSEARAHVVILHASNECGFFDKCSKSAPARYDTLAARDDALLPAVILQWTAEPWPGIIRQMRETEFEDKPVEENSIFKPASDTFMAAIPWTKNRTVVVLRRERNGRKYVRCRTFNRHKLKKVWYPTPRFYMVSLDCAEELGKAIVAAARGEPYGDPPGWWYDFAKQYEAGEWRRQPKAVGKWDEDWG